MNDSLILDNKIKEEEAGKRLDITAADIFECSRSFAASSINEGNILVNYKKRRSSYILKPGDLISGSLALSSPNNLPLAEAMPLDILFEDEHILVLNKKAGMVVHPGAGNFSNTLVNALLYHYPGISNVGSDPWRPGIVHRLDKDTSGVMVAAKTDRTLTFLQREFFYRRVEKWYLALVWGADLKETGKIDLPIARHPVHRKRMCVDNAGGRSAKTSWQVLKRFHDTCLVRIRLYTGRTHQIRVHFNALGYPLVGDPVYGFKKKNRKNKDFFQHQMLHSWKLRFSHPYSGRQMEYKAPIPHNWTPSLGGV